MSSYELATPGVVAEKFQEGVVVLNLDTGDYYDLGGRSAGLITALELGVDTAALAEALEQREAGAGAAMTETLTALVGFGLLRSVAAKTAVIEASVVEALLASGTGFALDAHSDLADFIAADPIHDLDHLSGKKTV